MLRVKLVWILRLDPRCRRRTLFPALASIERYDSVGSAFSRSNESYASFARRLNEPRLMDGTMARSIFNYFISCQLCFSRVAIKIGLQNRNRPTAVSHKVNSLQTLPCNQSTLQLFHPVFNIFFAQQFAFTNFIQLFDSDSFLDFV